MKNSKIFSGIIFILIGVLLLTNKFLPINLFNINYLWPLFILIPGISMEMGYFSSRRNPGVLVPGGILTTIGFLFYFEIFTDWRFAEYTWPIYILAVAIGLFQLYLATGRRTGLLIPILILTTTAVISFLSMIFSNIFTWIDSDLILPIIFIILGIYIIVKKK
ncbi:LiaI-LiaF-like domain-containing protein [Haloimpatiens massiliensis]|uniref:LiaI-LiaF-like domain-containing protein n=1 Tax=Haloimpatiens massiliensis TaxID=1658110 RepID=UPI000C815BF5|nr:DUF5668 domain-containing protein [Haloimpatiens massiliensis]